MGSSIPGVSVFNFFSQYHGRWNNELVFQPQPYGGRIQTVNSIVGSEKTNEKVQFFGNNGFTCGTLFKKNRATETRISEGCVSLHWLFDLLLYKFPEFHPPFLVVLSNDNIFVN